MAKKSSNRLRIIGGQWRSRMLDFPSIDGLRPTTDRIRETLFNWLAPHILGAKVLDVFAGSGALGFEALSREAARGVMLEKHPQAAKQLKENAKLLACNAEIQQVDALHYLAHCQETFDVIFLDPPFNKGLLPQCIELIQTGKLLAPSGWIYIESELTLTELKLPEDWHLHREKKAGQVYLRLFQSQQ
ncbi:16S rRNA (guanine(966)-N(2))-methyltransferase RsmD [Bermanella sp. R86510]|uniref:16S rRNA (guanine(966)-N(2))-methyltransferase RsmD n=1 Tax=unclassified Bermanella TaxID=2627862 RepID=UPI0037C72FED